MFFFIHWSFPGFKSLHTDSPIMEEKSPVWLIRWSKGYCGHGGCGSGCRMISWKFHRWPEQVLTRPKKNSFVQLVYFSAQLVTTCKEPYDTTVKYSFLGHFLNTEMQIYSQIFFNITIIIICSYHNFFYVPQQIIICVVIIKYKFSSTAPLLLIHILTFTIPISYHLQWTMSI